VSRRGFFLRWISLLGGTMLRTFGMRYGVVPDRIAVERVRIEVDGLPPHLEGFTIGVLSDLHLGPLVREEFVRSAAEKLAAERPNLVVVAGDLLSHHDYTKVVPGVLEPVQGALAVLGNWDYYAGTPWFGTGLRWLINRGVEVAPGLWVAGVDDTLYGRPDLRQALAGAPDGAVRILLCHEPDFADAVKPEHRIALQISGHSHGGQVRLPLFPPLLLPKRGRKYVAGLYAAPACHVYTTRGLGVAHLPLRLNCPPEISLLTLASMDGRRGGLQRRS
jgi:predicted MPP superfamily phosphohydrolase